VKKGKTMTTNNTPTTQTRLNGEAHPKAGVQSNDDAIIARALKILEFRARYAEDVAISSPNAARDYCRLKLGNRPHEVFAVLWLDAQNRLIEYEELFTGTLTQTSVYPREVVKAAMIHNAAGVILTHNHPSGVAEPSQADQMLTTTLKQALTLVDVKVLDHLVVSSAGTTSFAERGLL
jgi:DNA repair protein RadC